MEDKCFCICSISSIYSFINDYSHIKSSSRLQDEENCGQCEDWSGPMFESRLPDISRDSYFNDSLLNQGQPGMDMGVGGVSGTEFLTMPIVLQQLKQVVQENSLQHFYSTQRLEQIAESVVSKDILGLSRCWKLPNEVKLPFKYACILVSCKFIYKLCSSLV